MTVLQWDKIGERFFETGIDYAVLYTPNNLGVYNNGVAWNGVQSISESPSGAEANPQYADNIKYLNLISAEEFSATIEAFTCPPEFYKFDGTIEAVTGVYVGQQNRQSFGLSYRTRIGNDLQGDNLGYKLHLVYNCTAAPSERSYSTTNDSPEAVSLSWEIATTPIAFAGGRPTSLVTIDSTKVNPTKLADLEALLYGTVGTDPSLPTPDQVVALFAGAVLTQVTATAPTYNSGTRVLTIPTVTGVDYTIDGEIVTGTITLTTGQTKFVVAKAKPNYKLHPLKDADWSFDY